MYLSRRAAVLGSPVAHSLSPVLHRAAYAELGLAWTYERIECDRTRLPVLLAAAGAEWVGFSCTMPLKHAAVALADELTDDARAVAAANTLLRVPAGWRAANTDVAGIVGALRESGPVPPDAVVLGAGGTAQAAVVAVGRLGLDSCTLLARDPDRAGPVVATGRRAGVRVTVGRLAPGSVRAALVVSALPPGAADDWAGAVSWHPGQVLLDVTYDPWPSRLAAAAAGAGAVVVTGTLMLLHQAAAQVTLMTGREAPVEAMRAALRGAAPPGSLPSAG